MSYIRRPSVENGIGVFLLAALSAGFTGSAILTIWTVIASSGKIAHAGGLFILSFAVATIVCMIAGVLIGLPATLLLTKLGRESLGSYIFAGTIGGSLAASSVFLGTGLPDDPAGAIVPITGGIPGAIAGSIWWTMNRRNSLRTENE